MKVQTEIFYTPTDCCEPPYHHTINEGKMLKSMYSLSNATNSIHFERVMQSQTPQPNKLNIFSKNCQNLSLLLLMFILYILIYFLFYCEHAIALLSFHKAEPNPFMSQYNYTFDKKAVQDISRR